MNTINIPNALSHYSLTKTLTSGQTFRWVVNPTQSKTTAPLSNPTTDTFYLPIKHNQHNFIYKVTQNNDKIKWKTLGDAPENTDVLQALLQKRLGFNYNYTDALKQLEVSDASLFNTITPSLSIVQDNPFETTISFICSPQATIDRIYQMQRNLEYKYGTKIQTEDGIFYTFPTPTQLENATEDELQECNLGYRASYVKKTVTKINSGEITLPPQTTTLSTKTLKQQLQECIGVGTKVADCILLYAYNRTEVIPVDTRIQQMVTKRYDNSVDSPNKAKTKLTELWSDYGGYYQLLLYDLADSELN